MQHKPNCLIYICTCRPITFGRWVGINPQVQTMLREADLGEQVAKNYSVGPSKLVLMRFPGNDGIGADIQTFDYEEFEVRMMAVLAEEKKSWFK